MIFGVQYYPEHWPEERWPIDAALMQAAGVKRIRVGEFAWSKHEQPDGTFDFTWLERAIQLFADHGIKSILCTCSRTPPPWIYQQHPEILPVGADRHIRHSDGRYAIASAHPKFIELAERIDGALIRYFAGNPNIAAWQIDNEIGCHSDCFCDVCLGQFHKYLENKYGTPEKLNRAWGAHFWSFAPRSFEEIPRPTEQPQLRLEYRRFLSSLNCSFAAWRGQLIHELNPGKQITTNFQNLFTQHSDYHDLGRALDVNGLNHYPARTPELTLDYCRAARGEFWVLEQQTHLQTLDSPKGWMRLWAWMAIAHGASALIHFRWRQCRWGDEQFGDGILPHCGREGRLYREFAQTGKELEKVDTLIEQTRPRSQVALIFAYESSWALDAVDYPFSLSPVTEAIRFHKALAQRATSIDALDPREDLSSYKLVIAPRLWVVDDAIAANLHSFVKNGGTLCLTAGSGTVDEFGVCFDTPRPGKLTDIPGLWVSDMAFDSELTLSTLSESDPLLSNLLGSLAADEIHIEGASVVATHGSGWRKGQPAITSHRHGKGQVIYLGVNLDDPSTATFANWLAEQAGIPQQFDRPDKLSVYERRSEKIRLLFLINWNDQAQSFQVGTGWTDVFDQSKTKPTIIVPATDIRILQSPIAD